MLYNIISKKSCKGKEKNAGQDCSLSLRKLVNSLVSATCHLYNMGVFLSHNIKMDLLVCLPWDLCKDRLLKSSVLAISVNRQLDSVPLQR